MRCSGRASCSIRAEERPPPPDLADALRRFFQAIQPIAFLQDAPSRPCRDVAEIIPRSGKQLPRLADCVTNIGRSHLRNASCGDQLCIDRVDDPVPGIRTSIGKKDDCLAPTPLTDGRLDDPLRGRAPAVEADYADPTSFRRVFKRKVSLSPAAYRRMVARLSQQGAGWSHIPSAGPSTRIPRVLQLKCLDRQDADKPVMGTPDQQRTFAERREPGVERTIEARSGPEYRSRRRRCGTRKDACRPS
jgi:hypothetical protein